MMVFSAKMDPDEILGVLLNNSPISRSDLAREIGLSKSSVTNLVQEFSRIGILREDVPTISRNGRRGMGISLDLSDFYMISARIMREKIICVRFDGNGQERERREISFDIEITGEELLSQLSAVLNGCLIENDGRYFLGIVISTLGWLFEEEDRTEIHTDGFSQLGTVDIRAFVQQLFPGVPVLLEHDAKTSALAEYKDYIEENQVEPECLLNVVGGIGFGGGIIADGKIFRGANGVAGEVGHLGINFNSEVYTRNVESREFRGLFEDYASPRGLRRHMVSRLLDFPDSPLNEASSTAEIYAAFVRGDSLANWAVNKTCRLAAYGLTGLVFVLNPNVIVFSDEFPQIPQVLDRISMYLSDYLPAILFENLQLRISHRGADGILYGGYLLLMQWYRENKSLYTRLSAATTSNK